jgi:hypothetical protein
MIQLSALAMEGPEAIGETPVAIEPGERPFDTSAAGTATKAVYRGSASPAIPPILRPAI